MVLGARVDAMARVDASNGPRLVNQVGKDIMKELNSDTVLRWPSPLLFAMITSYREGADVCRRAGRKVETLPPWVLHRRWESENVKYLQLSRRKQLARHMGLYPLLQTASRNQLYGLLVMDYGAIIR